MKKSDTDTLEILFEEARSAPALLPDGLMDRILADAVAQQPAPALRGWRAVWRAIGGAPAFGGLVTAAVVGFWIGVAPPSALPDIAAQIITGTSFAALDTDSGAELTAFGWDIEEG